MTCYYFFFLQILKPQALKLRECKSLTCSIVTYSNNEFFKTTYSICIHKRFYAVITLKSFAGCTIPMISNGDSSPTGNITSGQTVTFSCSMGFSLNGSTTVTCQNDGTFSDAIPSCERCKSSTNHEYCVKVTFILLSSFLLI